MEHLCAKLAGFLKCLAVRVYCVAFFRDMVATQSPRWVGEARASVPDLGEPCIVDAVDFQGQSFRFLSRGRSVFDLSRIRQEFDTMETHVLSATLEINLGNETLHADVTSLCYSIPEHVNITPADMALLLHGYHIWNRMRRVDLVVNTMDLTYRFETDDPVSSSVFSSESCKDEAGICASGLGCPDNGSYVCRFKAKLS